MNDKYRYQEISEKLYKILKQFSDSVEMASIDEAYVDFLNYIADGAFGYNDSAKQMGFIKNLDTIGVFLEEPKIIANLKWKMLYVYLIKFLK